MKTKTTDIRIYYRNEKWRELHQKEAGKKDEKITISTEQQIAGLDDKYHFETELVTDDDKLISSMFLANGDYRETNLYFVLREIAPEYQPDYGGKKFHYSVFATDKRVKKRTDKWFSTKFEWHQIVKMEVEK